VFGVLCGDRDTGRALVRHPTPQMISITGSVRAGKEVAAAAGIAEAGYFSAGQDRTAATRVLVADRLAAEFTAALTEAARGTSAGPPDDAGAFYGPVNYSGYGKDTSMYGIEDYTRIKHVMHHIGS
jgi:betaine-aldehyde dehydrogenase